MLGDDIFDNKANIMITHSFQCSVLHLFYVHHCLGAPIWYIKHVYFSFQVSIDMATFEHLSR